MALTELQIPQKLDFYHDVRRLASEIASGMARFEAAAEFVNRMTAADLDAMQVPSQVRVDLVDMKNVLNELVGYYNGSQVTPAKNPSDVIDKLRSMLIT